MVQARLLEVDDSYRMNPGGGRREAITFPTQSPLTPGVTGIQEHEGRKNGQKRAAQGQKAAHAGRNGAVQWPAILAGVYVYKERAGASVTIRHWDAEIGKEMSWRPFI